MLMPSKLRGKTLMENFMLEMIMLMKPSGSVHENLVNDVVEQRDHHEVLQNNLSQVVL